MATIARWDGAGELKEPFINIARRLEDAIGIPVVIDVPHGNWQSPITDGNFYIHIWSNPDRPATENYYENRLPNTIFGICPNFFDWCYPHHDIGTKIEDGNGYIVGTIVANNLYIYHDCCHVDEPSEIEIFEKIIEQAIAVIKGTDIEEIRKNNKRQAAAVTRENFIKLCTKGIKDQQVSLSKKIKDEEKHAQDLRHQLTRVVLNVTEWTRQCQLLDKINTSDYVRTCKKNFAAIKKLSKVTGVEIVGDKFSFTTVMLKCEDSRTGLIHEIGKFKITIDPRTSYITFNNLTRKVNSYQTGLNAPHVFSSQEPCLGNMAEYLPELIGKYDFCTAVILAIQFIENANVDDSAGQHVNKWPLVGESEEDYQDRLSELMQCNEEEEDEDDRDPDDDYEDPDDDN